MTLKIKFNHNFIENNLLVFCDDKKKLPDLSKFLNKNQISFIKKFIHECDFKKKNFFDLNIDPKYRIVIVNLYSKEKQNLILQLDELGAKLIDHLKFLNISTIFTVKNNLENFLKLDKNFISKFLFGMHLRSYRFDKYKTKKNNNHISNICKKP